MTTQRLPQSTTTLYLQSDGTYAAASTGVDGETAVQVPITDLVCVDDLDQNGAETQSDLQALAQDVYHILWQTLGSDMDDPTRGIGVESFLSGSTSQLTKVKNIIDSQFRSDTRIDHTETTVSGSTATLRVYPVGAVLPITFSVSPTSGIQIGAAS